MPRRFCAVGVSAVCIIASLLLWNAEPRHSAVAPLAERRPHRLEAHGHVRIDDYYWLRDRDDPRVLAYLRAENDYARTVLQETEPLQQTLFTKMKRRIPQTDVSAPYPDRDHEYYTRTDADWEYPVYCRRPLGGDDAAEEILLDVNDLAAGRDYCSIGAAAVSPDANKYAFAVDFEGRRKHTLRIKDLRTGQLLPDALADLTENFVWAGDNQHLFYTRQDPETLRYNRIYRHRLGTDPRDDALVFEEHDEEFSCHVYRSRSREYVLIACTQTLSSEVHAIPADRPTEPPVCLQPREANHEYSLDHLGEFFYIHTNWNAENFRLMKTPRETPGKAHWIEVVPHRDDVFLEDVELFSKQLVVQERRNAQTSLRILPLDGGEPHQLEFGEECYAAGLAAIAEPETAWLRYWYSSLTTPDSILDYHMETREKRVVKREEVLGDFHSENYVSRRLWATADDGARIPVSVVYRRETPLDGTAPCLQYGYGAYGASEEAYFDASLLNLLDRGFVYAIAHVRGGQELGRTWYEQGKLLHKRNTFTDFIAVGEYLIREQLADPRRLYAQGGSAGGLLVGAVMNLRPELYAGVISEVPFVDALTTMLDPTIPLTTSEYDEWGNPGDEEYFRYILSYSPYDNVRAVDYPALLVTAGLHDSQVQYWEPAKWVARLRALKTDDNWLLLKTEMHAGHDGVSGRDNRYREIALKHAFLLHLVGRER